MAGLTVTEAKHIRRVFHLQQKTGALLEHELWLKTNRTTFLVLLVCLKARKMGELSFIFKIFRGVSINDVKGKKSTNF